MTAQDKSNIVQLINYYDALAQKSHRVSRKPGLAQVMAGFSSGRASTLHDVCKDLVLLIEAGEVEV